MINSARLLAVLAALLIASAAWAQQPKSWLGVDVRDVTKDEATQLGWEAPRGVKVMSPRANGPAARAGILAQDVIISVDGREVENKDRGRCRPRHLARPRPDADDAGAGPRAAGHDRPPRLRRHHRLRRPHRGQLRDRPGGAGSRPHRLHPSLQRHAAARRPRARPGRRRARRPGLLGAASSSTCTTSPRASLRIAIAANGWQRMMLVTDAMPSVGTDITEFPHRRQRITPQDGRADHRRRHPRRLRSRHGERRCAIPSSISACRSRRRCTWPPASRPSSCGLGDELGRIAPGYRADLVLLDDDLSVVETWIDGMSVSET